MPDNKAKFAKVDVDKELKVSTYQPMDKEEVEDEVLQAMREGLEQIEKLEAEREVLQNENVRLATECMRLDEELENVRKPKELPTISKKTRAFINDLRTRDTPKATRTCACCTKRCVIPKEIMEHDDFCYKCQGK